MSFEASRLFSLEVFSARDFYESRNQENGAQAGRITLSLPLHEKGIAIHSEDMTIAWIDGAFAQALQREIFFERVHSGEIPTPLFSSTAHTSPSRLFYTSPEALLERECTLLEALALSEDVCREAWSTCTIRCSRCAAITERFRHPLELTEAILRDWASQKITVLAGSPNTLLAQWAAKHGFTAHTSANGDISVTLDEIECSTASVRKLVPSIRALWRVPKLVFACSSNHHAICYSRQGWCPDCQQINSELSRSILFQLLSSGFSSADALRSELQLCIDGTIALRALLSTPIHLLNVNRLPILQPARDALTALHLDHLTFGTLVHDISPQDLTLLSACISIQKARHQKGLVILELPSGLLTDTQTARLKGFAEKSCGTTPIVVIEERRLLPSIPECARADTVDQTSSKQSLGTLTLTTNNPHQVDSVFDLRLGESIRIYRAPEDTHSLLYDIYDALLERSPADNRRARIAKTQTFSVTALPVFDSMRRSKKMVLDELGFAEPLAQLYAASLDARLLGLAFKDFLITSGRRNPHLCPACQGLGVHVSIIPELPRPLAEPCHTCHGLRFKAPVGKMLFRGTALATILNQSIADSIPLLSALRRSKETLELITSLHLTHIPLGMPLSLLRGPERRAISIIGALVRAKPTNPAILLMEEPRARLSDVQLDGLDKIRRDPRIRELTCWIEIASKADGFA